MPRLPESRWTAITKISGFARPAALTQRLRGMQMYLLEVSRVVERQADEGNFHCFHSLLSAAAAGSPAVLGAIRCAGVDPALLLE
jgi:hypothetical protein